MKIRNVFIALIVVVGGATSAGSGQAQPPMVAADHVACLMHAIPPYKAGNAANAPIAFGYQVHCTGRPDGRQIEYVLNKNGSAVAFGRDKSTDPDKTEVFFYECSTGGSISQFTTYVAMIGQHVNVDFTEDTSGTVSLQC
ncbi:hypothetical protein [Nocardia sp. XZ_19_369]|uniref:hypothetical protein n=1 Tax=Nocardia sp. XZ_19_369 TaxID=2769487 RepID=UPI00188FACD9|nr:hypothetical protein [Nocardia sp. XZ_19_369]